jgi:hypothetical protein
MLARLELAALRVGLRALTVYFAGENSYFVRMTPLAAE